MNSGVFYGIASAVLFGVSTPLAKTLVGSIPPLWLAALLYLGAGLGLLMVLGARWVFATDAPIALPTARDWTWIGAAIGLGGVVGPIALMYGLTLTTAASASLLAESRGRPDGAACVVPVQGELRPSHCAGHAGDRCRRDVADGDSERWPGLGARIAAGRGGVPLLGARQQPDAQGLRPATRSSLPH